MTTTLEPPILAGDSPRPFHWTVEAYHRAAEAGAFGQDARVELVYGRVIERMSQSNLHANLVEYIMDCLRTVVPPQYRVRDEKPIQIACDGEPIPDITVITGSLRNINQPTPDAQDVPMLVDVSVSTEAYDLGEKALLYAQAGIKDYWVVVPKREQIVVHRDPTPEGYASVTVLKAEAEITPLVTDRPLVHL
jgi:Uma2 family endonuclease